MPRPSGRWAPRRRPSGSIAGIVRCRSERTQGPEVRASKSLMLSAARSVEPAPRSVFRAALGALRVFPSDDRLDDAVIARIATVEDRNALVLGVHEDEELMAQLLHPSNGILFEHRLDGEPLHLHDAGLRPGRRRPVGEPSKNLLLLLRSSPQAGLLLVVDGLALDLVDDLVDGDLVARALGMAVERLAIDDERHVGHMGIGCTPMLLIRELHDHVRSIVEQPVEPSQPTLGILADAVRDLDVLALDDRP